MATARYQNGCVYKIVCKDPEVTECYVGSCCNFTRRKYGHKSDCHNINRKNYNLKVYTFIREHGGWDNWEMIQLKHYHCNSKRELELEERKHFEELKATLNTQVPTRNQKQYRQDNKEKLAEYNKQQYQNNKEKIAEYNKQYRQNNKEKIAEQNKQYQEDNKEKLAEKHKQHYQNNKEKIAEQKKQKFECECGGRYTQVNKSKHHKSKKHLRYMGKK